MSSVPEGTSIPASVPLWYLCRIQPSGEFVVSRESEKRFIDKVLGNARMRSMNLALDAFGNGALFKTATNSYMELEQAVRSLPDSTLSDSLRASVLREINKQSEWEQFDQRR